MLFPISTHFIRNLTGRRDCRSQFVMGWLIVGALLLGSTGILGCTGRQQQLPPKNISGFINFNKRTLTDPTFEQIESSFKTLKWQDPNELPLFEIAHNTQKVRISRWFDRNYDGDETFEKSERMVAVWHNPASDSHQQCQLEGADQGLDLVMKFAKQQDISSMLDWFEY